MSALEDFIRRAALDWWNEGNEEGARDLLAVAHEIAQPGVPAAKHMHVARPAVCAAPDSKSSSGRCP